MNLSISLLGTFDVRRDGQPICDFRSQSVRALLAYLVIEANRPHEREHLCALLWPGEPLAAAQTNLRQALHRLRQALEPAGAEGRYLWITRQSVQLNPHTVCTDIAHFQKLIDVVAKHPHRSAVGCPQCIAHVSAALNLAQGHLLPGFSLAGSDPFEEWLLFERERCNDQMAWLCDIMASAHERRGELVLALDLLRRWVWVEPWCEQAHLRMIRTLAMLGRRALALRHVEHYRAALSADLGIDPGQAISDLACQIRMGSLPPPPTIGVRHAPIRTSPIVGRSHDLQRVCDLLGDPACRLLSLVGPGGSGKTRLALEAAHTSCYAFADGAIMVSLANISQAKHVHSAILEALGIEAIPGLTSMNQLIDTLRERDLLLVLDTCEQVQGLPGLLAALLVAVPRLTVLVTSRASLHLRAEWVVSLGGLAFPDDHTPPPDPASYPAGQLFLQAARQFCPDFTPDSHAAALVLTCCRLVDGMPLGIELAASQLRTCNLDEIVAAMQVSLDSLATTMSDLPMRHWSLRKVFDWSWELLSPPEQQTLVSMTACIHTEPTYAETATLDQLVAKSLLQCDADGRYWMHTQIDQFARQYMPSAGEDQVWAYGG